MKYVEDPEINYRYPHQWIEEYRRTGIVQHWYEDYPELFYGSRGTCFGSGDNKKSNLSTYALMYLLKRNEGVESLTYFRLAAKGKSRDGRREALQKYLRENESARTLGYCRSLPGCHQGITPNKSLDRTSNNRLCRPLAGGQLRR